MFVSAQFASEVHRTAVNRLYLCPRCEHRAVASAVCATLVVAVVLRYGCRAAERLAAGGVPVRIGSEEFSSRALQLTRTLLCWSSSRSARSTRGGSAFESGRLNRRELSVLKLLTVVSVITSLAGTSGF